MVDLSVVKLLFGTNELAPHHFKISDSKTLFDLYLHRQLWLTVEIYMYNIKIQISWESFPNISIGQSKCECVIRLITALPILVVLYFVKH